MTQFAIRATKRIEAWLPTFFAWVAIVLLLLASGCRKQEATADLDGPRPEQMDAAYVDRDGDLLADTPTDPSRLLDPNPLVFAFTPVEDPAVYADIWQPFLDHLAKVTGKEVQFFPVQSNASQYEAMRAGRLHLTGVNAGGVPVAVNLCGFQPFCVMASDDGRQGYEMEIIVPAGSGIQSPEQLKGHTIAFTSPTSNSGHKAPSVLLEDNFGLKPGTDYQSVYSGKHDNSILGVANGDYEAAAVSNIVLHRMTGRGDVNPNDVRTIYQSQTFPATGFGHIHNLKPELAAKIRKAFFTFDWTGTAMAKEFGQEHPPKSQFVPIDYKKDWAVIRQIDEALGVQYAID